MLMRKWCVEFKGYCVVEGSDYEDAEYNFFNNIHPDPQNAVCNEEYYIADIAPYESEDDINV